MQKLKAHLTDVDESYFEHLNHAGGFGLRMIGGGLACLVHALLPFAFITTGSQVIVKLHDKMVVNRRKDSNSTDSGSSVDSSLSIQ